MLCDVWHGVGCYDKCGGVDDISSYRFYRMPNGSVLLLKMIRFLVDIDRRAQHRAIEEAVFDKLFIQINSFIVYASSMF